VYEIISIKLFGTKKILALLNECEDFVHLEAKGTISARIKYNLARTCLLTNDLSRARTLLLESRIGAIANDCHSLTSKIDDRLGHLAIS
jgi:hypothetical protein